ncbi:hypothetical protein HDF16_002505 [Granulicella aggregans]|uniref:Uncharacterized protein n=1 Tax=Granulicella aggregans TaxID=474949 RepID=A0A7W8E407_9BACT|nr:hypothetical protein [Granulicella aggregans]MBB5057799.1 hypothetical protein [Granulicella aggregans]
MSTSRRRFLIATIAALLVSTAPAHADPARFDLAGPKVEVRVTRDGVTLPVAQVPNLKVGDKIWLHPDFPPSQSVKYLLVAAFLRGTTNPPPDNWFTRIETWNKGVQSEGVFITVPPEAQQVILFLAPETGGDFTTLRSAVKGRPGIFVRASQDLNEAGFEQARIEKYLESMKTVDPNDAKALSEHSTLLARTLALKPNENCFKQPVDAQYNCLTQSGNQLLLDDGHGQTVAAALSNGPSSDFILQASNTSLVGGGLYSAYVGAIVDLVRLTASLHTAQYQYIPAIAFPSDQQLNLRLNAPPSFHNPKSVIVIGLPGIQAATPPPLRAADPKQVACLLRPDLVLGLEGAPLVYSTSFAHELTLHVNSEDRIPDVPLAPDAFRGGLIVNHERHREMLPVSTPDDAGIVTVPTTKSTDDPKAATSADAKPVPKAVFPPGTLTGTVSGMWGFDHFTGPTLPLQNVPGKGWKLVTTDPLIVGQDNHLTLASSGTACVQAIISDSVPGTETKLDWKRADKPDEISLNLPLKSLNKDTVELAIKQYGAPALDKVTAKTYSEPAKLESLNLHAGDSTAVLSGTSLDQVKQLELKGIIFTPTPSHDAPQASESKGDLQLSLDTKTSDAKAIDSKNSAPKLSPGDKLTATATLKDGRTLTLPFTVGSARPSITLLSKGIDQAKSSPIHLSPDDLPINDKLTFFLKSADNYPRGQQIEIASTDDSLHTKLGIADGTLVLQNKHTVLATLEPLKVFGPSAFGPLRLRAIAPDGTTGEWIPLATIVRLPTLTDLHCPTRVRQQPCTLEGSDLYLVDAFSTDQAFTTPTEVPEGFVGNTISIPHPGADTTFYVRLRDDPSTTNQVTLPVLPLSTPPQPAPPASSSVPAQPSAATAVIPPTK